MGFRPGSSDSRQVGSIQDFLRFNLPSGSCHKYNRLHTSHFGTRFPNSTTRFLSVRHLQDKAEVESDQKSLRKPNWGHNEFWWSRLLLPSLDQASAPPQTVSVPFARALASSLLPLHYKFSWCHPTGNHQPLILPPALSSSDQGTA